MKVVILCNDFPPINSIGAERPYSWYFYLKELGITPVVITKNWVSDPNSKFPFVDSNTTKESTDKGFLIRVSDASTPSILFRNIFGNKLSIVRKALTFMSKILSFPFSSFDQHRNIYKQANTYIQNNDVDLVITSGEPFILFKYGRLLKRTHKIHWIADYRDGWYLNHVFSISNNFITRFMRWYEFKFEKKYMKAVDLILTVDPQLSSRLNSLFNKKSAVVYNGFWKFYETNKVDSQSECLVFNHTGTLTIGQRVEVLLQSIVELIKSEKIDSKKIKVNFIGLDFFPAQANRVLNYHPLLKNVVSTTPRVPKKEAIEMNLNADYMLNFTDSDISAIYAKTYDYIACKKPIIVVPCDNGILSELVLNHNLGFVAKSKDDLKNLLCDILNDKLQKNKISNLEGLNFFTRKSQAIELSKIIHDF